MDGSGQKTGHSVTHSSSPNAVDDCAVANGLSPSASETIAVGASASASAGGVCGTDTDIPSFHVGSMNEDESPFASFAALDSPSGSPGHHQASPSHPVPIPSERVGHSRNTHVSRTQSSRPPADGVAVSISDPNLTENDPVSSLDWSNESHSTYDRNSNSNVPPDRSQHRRSLPATLAPSGSALKNPRSKSPFKSVTFADYFGQDLKSVLSFETFEDLDFTVTESPKEVYSPLSSMNTFAPLFFLPPNNDALIAKVHENKVKLESVHIVGMAVIGSILVSNLSFNKEVAIRYSINNWEFFQEVTANYVPGSSFRNCDRFSFEVLLDASQIHDRVMFCVRYKCEEVGEFWDSNNGLNYTLRLLTS